MNNGIVNPFQVIINVLETRQSPVKVFFRNDDGGWADERLLELASYFSEQDLPLDVAVIPDALSTASVDLIKTLLDSDSRFSIHQHGFAHRNHQLSGRNGEFGTDRNYDMQFKDIAAGRERLIEFFGNQVMPVFTPPWNRCTGDTAAALHAQGFKFLSRITGADSIGDSIAELPVTIDWLKKRKGVSLTTSELVEYICGLLTTNSDVVGVMLHHEHMDQSNRQLLHQFIETLRQSDKVSFHTMMSVAG